MYSEQSIHMVRDRLLQAYGAQQVDLQKSDEAKASHVDGGTYNQWMQRKFLFDIFGDVLNDDILSISPQCLDDLQLLCGAVDHPDQSLMSKMDRTRTSFGEGYCAYRLANPFTDFEDILESQNLVKDLAYDDLPYTEIASSLDNIRRVEPELYSYFQEFSEEAQKAVDLVYFKKMGYLNKSSIALETSTRMLQAWNTGLLFLPAISNAAPRLGLKFIVYQLRKKGHDIQLDSEAAEMIDPSVMSIIKDGLKVQYDTLAFPLKPSNIKHGWWAARNFKADPLEHLDHLPKPLKANYPPKGKLEAALNSQFESKRTASHHVLASARWLSRLYYPANTAMAGLYYYVMYKAGSELKKHSDVALSLHKKLMGFAVVCQEAEKLKALIGDRIPCPELPQEIRGLYSLLNTRTFTSPSRASLVGRVLKAHKLVCEHKEKFAELLAWIGKIDAYVGMATLARDEHAFAPYCFVDFMKNETPYIAAEGFWNPFIDRLKVVKNNIIIGDKEQTSNVIITGPNAGGKSTTMKAIITNLILAQSFGIAAAETCTMTPFVKIYSTMGPTDDIASGKSHFVAEVERAKQILNVARTEDGFKFFAIDELFTGTGHDKAAQLAAKMLKELIECEDCLTISATHYPELTVLEEETGRCTNMRVVPPVLNADGKLQYPYQIEPGISTVNVADDIMEHMEF